MKNETDYCNLHFWAAKTIIEHANINAEKENTMGRNSIIQLIVAIIFLGLFFISWLVFGNIKTTDWVSLIVGVLFLIAFFLGLKKNKGNKQ